jgi:hypothetical protein
MKAFLLRFEEETAQEHSIGGKDFCISTPAIDKSHKETRIITAGTKTLTEVRHESVDADPGAFTLSAFPR